MHQFCCKWGGVQCTEFVVIGGGGCQCKGFVVIGLVFFEVYRVPQLLHAQSRDGPIADTHPRMPVAQLHVLKIEEPVISIPFVSVDETRLQTCTEGL